MTLYWLETPADSPPPKDTLTWGDVIFASLLALPLWVILVALWDALRLASGGGS